MMRLQFYLWRRDAAVRKLAANQQLGVRSRRQVRRGELLEQRAERWARLAMIQQRRVLGLDAEMSQFKTGS